MPLACLAYGTIFLGKFSMLYTGLVRAIHGSESDPSAHVLASVKLVECILIESTTLTATLMSIEYTMHL